MPGQDHLPGERSKMDDRNKTRDELIHEINDLRRQLDDLRLSQKALKENEKNLRALFDAIPESVCLMKPDGGVLAVNRPFAERLNTDESDIVGRSVFEFVPESVGERRRNWIRTVTESARPLEVIDERSGILLHHHLYPVFDEAGAVDRLAIYATNITEQKATQKELEISRRNYALLFKHMIEGVASCRMIYEGAKPTDFVFLDVNDSFERLSGLKDVVGKRISELVPELPELDHELLEIYGRVASSGKTERFEMYLESMQAWFDVSVYGLEKDTFVAVFDNVTDKKEAEKSLRESEEKFRRLIETANEGVWAMDECHRTTLVNDKMTQMLGFTRDEMLGAPVSSFMFEEDLSAHRDKMKGREHGKDDFYERRFRHKNGAEVWTLVSATALMREDGEFLGSFGMFTDITEIKRTLAALRESEQRYRAVVDNIQIGMAVLSPKMEVVSANKAFKDIFPNIKTGHLQFCYEQCNTPPLLAPCEHCPCVLTLEDGKVHEAITETIRGSDKRYHRLISSPIVDSQGQVVLVIELVEDITDTVRSSEKIRLEKDKLKNILNSFNNGVYIVNANHDIEYVNPAIISEFGDTSGKKCFEFFHDRADPCPWCKFSETEQGRTVQWEWTSQKTGRTYDLFDAPLTNDDGSISKLEIFHDVTDRKRTEQELRDSEERLRFKLDSVLKHDSSLTGEELKNVLVMENIQSLMDDFYQVTGACFAVLDLEGNVLVGVGWQDICTKFHRVNPRTCKNCLESDLAHRGNLKPGEVVSYKCKNNLNDVISPLYIADKLVGYVYTGQLFFDDEEINPGLFELQAEKYGFDKASYIEALSRVPRFSRQRVDSLMSYLVKLTTMISRLGDANLKMARSVIEQKQVETELREIQENLKLIVDNAPIILLISAGPEELIEYVNPRYSELLGYSTEDIKCVSDWWTKAYPDQVYREQVKREWNSRTAVAVNNRTSIEPMEVKVKCKDGSEKIIAWGFVSTGSKNVVFGLDLTQRKTAEAEKDNLQEKLLHSQKMEAVGTLAGGIAHDFNNLLQVVIGYSELIGEDPDLPEHLKTDLNKVYKASMDGAELVKGLMMFGRKTPAKMAPLNLNEHIIKIRKLLNRTIPKMIEIILRLEKDLPVINADKTQIEQILMNLAVNSRDAMPNGGELIVETSVVNLTEKSLPDQLFVVPGRYIKLKVSDTGSGIPEDAIGRIFEPFFTTKEVGKGTGLGLSVVYGIVQQHNGYMTCSSELQKGTVFEIYFPVTDSDCVGSDCLQQQRVVPSGGRETILIVDDDDAVRSLASGLLGSAGYKIVEASDGYEAFRIYEVMRSSIDLVILDLVMPRMGGIECLDLLLQINPNVRVVIASGYADEGWASNLMEKGAIACVAKPYNQLSLLEIVRSVLDNNDCGIADPVN